MEKKLAQSWLSIQCQMIPDVIGAVAILNISLGDAVKPTACWPDDVSVNPDLLAAASLAMSRQAPVVSSKGSDSSEAGKENLVVACPLFRKEHFYGIVSVQVTAPQGQQATIIRLLQWGATWLNMILTVEDGAVAQSSPFVISTLAAALKSDHIEAAAHAIVNELMQHLSCERVSIGLIKNGNVQLEALSQSASYEVSFESYSQY